MAEPRPPVLAVEELTYRYPGGQLALDRVSLSVAAGERVALVGPNGCGKTTLLKVLDGLIFGESGTFWAFGEEITEDRLEDEARNRRFRSRVGFVFQDADAQVFSPTVRDELAFGPLNMGLAPEEVLARVDDLLALLDLGELADRAPFQLSGGQKQRVAIASVLIMAPEVLLLDEPTAALDPATKRWLLDLLDELGRAGRTLVVATHDPATLEVLGGRCVEFGGAGAPS